MLASVAILLLGVSTASASADGDWSLHKMTAAAESKGARCLDGSPAAYYLRQPLAAPPAGSRPFVVFMEGGGWCLESSCLSRAGTDLGSSTNYPAVPGGMEGGGLYAEFATATVIYMKYCDGGSFTGNADAPVTFPGSTQKIYYRGRRILDALFEELLDSRGLSTATELLFAGCSAGALTTYVHADYVSTLMARRVPGAKTVALADAMFSLHHDAFPANPSNYYTNQFKWGFTAWNSSASINQKCLAAYSGSSANASSAWVCFHGAVAAQFVTTPLFIANSKYDTWQERGVLGLNTTECTSHVALDGTVTLCNGTSPDARAQEKFWLAYGDAMVAALNDVSKRHAAFLVNCPTHCQSDPTGWRHPAFPGTQLGAAVKQWYPQALANLENSSWVAPRWVARDGDKCLVPATPPTPPAACHGPKNSSTNCASDFGGGNHPCPSMAQPLCAGFVQGKAWGHCCARSY